MAQLLMQAPNTGLSNPVDMIFATQPWMIATMTPLVLAIEIVPAMTAGSGVSATAECSLDEIGVPTGAVLAVIGGSIAFLLELSEYLLLSHTSSLTLSIASIFKVSRELWLRVSEELTAFAGGSNAGARI